MMTMPHLMNCEHSDDGWCLGCVNDLHARCERAEAVVASLPWGVYYGEYLVLSCCSKKRAEMLAELGRLDTVPNKYGDIVVKSLAATEGGVK